VLTDKDFKPLVTILRAHCTTHFAIHKLADVPDVNGRIGSRRTFRRYRVTHRQTGARVGDARTLKAAREYVERLESFGADCWVSSDPKDYQCRCAECEAAGMGAFMAPRVREAYRLAEC